MTDDLGDSPSMDLIDARAARLLHIAAWVVALIVFELTADPSLVVLVGCAKFGWVQLRAARWLRRSDPIRARGRACRWFYVSWGLWRISVVATLMMFVVAFVFEGLRHALGAMPRRGNAPPPQFMVALLTALFGFLFSTLTSIFGVVSAWRSRSRVWVGHAGIDAFRSRTWPPIAAGADRNRMGDLLITAVPFALVFGIVPFAMVVMTIVLRTGGKVAGEGAGAIILISMMVASVIGGAVGLIIGMDRAKRRMEADSPADCWGDQVETPPPSNQITFGSALR